MTYYNSHSCEVRVWSGGLPIFVLPGAEVFLGDNELEQDRNGPARRWIARGWLTEVP